MPEIIVKLDETVLQTRPFEGEILRIGRSRDNDIVLENLSVSRHHCQLRQHDGRYTITDIESANGILLNGVRTTKAEVVDEDIITIGKHKLIFRVFPEGQETIVLDDSPATADAQGNPPAVVQTGRPDVRLVVVSGRLKDREFKITRFETSLGKAPTNDIVLTDDWLLGKKQAIILRKGNCHYEIQDLGGLRRVKVNRKPVSERADLNAGDIIELGGTKLSFHLEGVQPQPPKLPVEEPEPEQQPAQQKETSASAAENDKEFLDNQSLDLEEGALIAAGNGSISNGSSGQPQSESGKEESPSRPQSDSGRDGSPSRPHAADGNANGNGASEHPQSGNVFEGRQGRKRRRKRNQRAAAKAAAQAQQESSDAPAAQQNTGRDGNQPSAHAGKEPQAAASDNLAVATDNSVSAKEISIWEEALQSNSPAIRRQAARTLKKLTGRDYEV